MVLATRKRAGAKEIIPGKLYQRGQFLTWPARQKMDLLEELGVDVVCNLWSKIDSDLSSEHPGAIYLNWHCSPSEMPHDAEATIAYLVSLMRAGHRLLVHCEAGQGRSVWLVSRLTAEFLGISREEAFTRVREAVGNTSVHGPLLADLVL